LVWGFCPDEDDYVIKDREENVETHAVVTREVRGNPAWFLGSEHEYMDAWIVRMQSSLRIRSEEKESEGNAKGIEVFRLALE